jgi:hypothetical protein
MRLATRIGVTLLLVAFALLVLLGGGAEAAQVVRESFSLPGVAVGCF